MIQSGKKVLVIGANNHESNYQDLKTLLTTNPKYSEIIAFHEIYLHDSSLHKTNDSLLTILAFDLPTSELSLELHSEMFNEYVKNLSIKYDMVLIDAPSYNFPSDLFAVARISDGLIVTLSLGIASKEKVKTMIQGLNLSKIPVIGIVLTKLSRKSLRIRRKPVSLWKANK